MSNKRKLALIFLVVLASSFWPIEQGQGQENGLLGPYNIYSLPLSAVPAPRSDAVYAPAYVNWDTGVSMQVLQVLRDPRDIPLERWYHYGVGGSVVPPAAWSLMGFNGVPAALQPDGQYMALAVYVQAAAVTSQDIENPFYVPSGVTDEMLANDRVWPGIRVGGLADLVCTAPANTGETLNKEGFDPASYLPPEPHYPSDVETILSGTALEGWILCLSTVKPLSDVSLAWYERDDDGEHLSTAWMPVNNLYAGEMVMYYDGEIKTPAPGSKVVYQGPVALSVMYGAVMQAYHASSTRGDPAYLVPGRLIKVFVNLDWMQDASQPIPDDVVLYGVDLIFATSSGPDGMQFGEPVGAIGQRLPGGAGWISALVPEYIPGDMTDVWVLARVGGWGGPIIGKWKVVLYDITPPPGAVVGVCDQDDDCLSPEMLVGLSNWSSQTTDSIPVLCPGNRGNGVTVLGARHETRTVYRDTLGLYGMAPEPGYHPLVIDVVVDPIPRVGFMLLQVSGDESIEYFVALEKMYQGAGEVAFDSFVPGIRSVARGLAVVTFSNLPAGISLENTYLIMTYTGPAWRLQCEE